jgi:hypothetical protein
MKNIKINEELKAKRLSYYLGKKNKDLNNSLKEVNKAFTINFIEENNKNKCNTERNFNIKENLANKGELKKIEINKIKPKIDSSNLNKSKIAEKTKKIDKNKSFYNSNANNGSSVTIKEYKMKNKDKDKGNIKDKNVSQDNIQSSIYKILKKTKDFFTNGNKEDDDKDKDKTESKKLLNQNFYKSQTNFYKKKNENKNEIANASDNEYNYNRKNSSTIIINNNININIDNKITKIKIPQLSIKNSVLISKNNYSVNDNNNYDTQRVDKNKNKTFNVSNNTNTAKKNLHNIFNKFSFNKKDLDKQKK